MSDNEFDDIMKAMPSNISNLDSVYTCFKDEHDKWCDSIKNAYAENNDKGMGELGWVKLPVDADGMPIRVGDVVTMQLLFGGESKPLVVDRMELSHGKDGDLWCVALDTDKGCWNQPSLMRHYTPPTVEDVLQEMLEQAVGYSDAHTTVALNAIAECAAKLRLADDSHDKIN